jgi:hypothetical protein
MRPQPRPTRAAKFPSDDELSVGEPGVNRGFAKLGMPACQSRRSPGAKGAKQVFRPLLLLFEVEAKWHLGPAGSVGHGNPLRSDIELALGILVEHQRRGKPLRLIEDFRINEETGEVKVLMPEWQTSLIAEFHSLFDEDEARYRFMKTYNELIGKRMTGPGLN